jgi:hypothetical protein
MSAAVHPYRSPVAPAPERPAEMPSEERFLIVLLVVIGGALVMCGRRFDTGSTVGLMMVVTGVVWMLRR